MARFVAAVALASLLTIGVSARSGDTRPNILLVNTDDQPSWWVGAYGNKDVHTPTIFAQVLKDAGYATGTHPLRAWEARVGARKEDLLYRNRTY